MRSLSALTLLLLLSIRMYAQDFSTSLKEIGEKNNLVGMSACVVRSDKIIHEYYFGLRDIERNLPVNDSTVYRIASISKMFTVTALMQLYDRKLFRLDDDVNNYLDFKLRNPNFPDTPITFSMLMSHTAGLREGKGYDGFLEASYQMNPIPELKSVLCKEGSFYSEDMWSSSDSPDKCVFSYANINFGILGTLVERISGERFDTYCINHIFNPLHLNASFDVRDIIDINQVAVIYRKQDLVWVPQTDQWKGVRPSRRNLTSYKPGSNAVIFAPQGGVRISAKDLTVFMLLHKKNGFYQGIRILSDSSARLMHKVVWKSNGQNGDNNNDFFTNYALGCMQTDKLIPGKMLIGHSGDAYGLLSDMYYSESEDFGIVFITNGGWLKKGNYSGWYSVEEDFFKACYLELKKQKN